MVNNQQKKRVAIFGSTGSVGTQALEVIAANPELFSAEVLTAQQNADLLIKQALRFLPDIVVIGDESKYQLVKKALDAQPIKVFSGEKSLQEVAAMDSYDVMMAAIVGFAGLYHGRGKICVGAFLPQLLQNGKARIFNSD